MAWPLVILKILPVTFLCLQGIADPVPVKVRDPVLFVSSLPTLTPLRIREAASAAPVDVTKSWISFLSHGKMPS
jgi:hypothetical protein